MRFSLYFNKQLVKACSLCFLLSISVLSHSANDSERLGQLLSGYTSFKTDFSQVTVAENGRTAQQTEGSLWLGKPNKFRWETLQPFPQEIVSDGQYIWIHDPDLEQVTRRDATAHQGSAPAMILNGELDKLEKNYQIFLDVDEGGLQIFSLKPINDQPQFSQIRLAFDAEVITELMLEDSLGQRTTILFKEQQLNPDISAEQFYFRVPEGTDLIVDGEY